jgi:hypothetical protein
VKKTLAGLSLGIAVVAIGCGSSDSGSATGSGGSPAGGGSNVGGAGASSESGGGGGTADASSNGGGGSGGDGGSAHPPKLGPPFVAVGYGALRASSNDGKSWTVAPDPTTLPAGWTRPLTSGDDKFLLRGACTGLGRYLSVGGTGGDQGLMLASNDATTWALVGGAMANDDCAFGNGVWITNTRYSPDGRTWTQLPYGKGASARAIVFGDGKFVAAGDEGGGSIAYSTDGQSWKTLAITFVGTDQNRKGYNAIAFGEGRFVAINANVADAPVFTWDGASDTSFKETPRPAELGMAPLYGVVYGQGAFYLLSFDALYRSTDGSSTWELLQGTGGRELYHAVITDEIFVSDRYWSIDGKAWNASTGTSVKGVTKIIGSF